MPDDSDATKSTVEELEQIILFEYLPDRKVYLGTGLTPELRNKLIEFLRANADCFAWSHIDMTGIPPEVTTHKLSLDGRFPPSKAEEKAHCRSETRLRKRRGNKAFEHRIYPGGKVPGLAS